MTFVGKGMVLLALVATVRVTHWLTYPDKYAQDQTSWNARYNNTLLAKLFGEIRERGAVLVRTHLPSPHSELLLGMTLGIDSLDMVPRFKQELRETGTIHVVVVSGSNMALVFDIIYRLVGSRFSKRNILIAEVLTLLYALLAGFEAPIVRAWLMGSVAGIGKYSGRKISSIGLLVATCTAMVIVNPVYIGSLSFQLSFMASLGVVLANGIQRRFRQIASYFIQTVVSSSIVQILIWPIISYHIGTVALLSPLVNGFVLWTVPLSIFGGFLYVAASYVLGDLTRLLTPLIYAPLDIFVRLIRVSSTLATWSVIYQITTIVLLAYYLLLACIVAKTLDKI